MCNRFCFQAQIMINRYFTHMNIQRDIWKCRTWEKVFQVQPCPSHYKTLHLHETGLLNTSSTLQSTVASRKHPHRSPALALGASAAVLKTTTLHKPLALRAQLASGVRQDRGGAKETPGGCAVLCGRQSAGSARAATTRSHHGLLPTVPGPLGASQLSRESRHLDFLCEISFFKGLANISDHNNLFAG